MSIPPYQVALTAEQVAEVLRGTEHVLKSGVFLLGEQTQAFEAAFSQVTGGRDVVAVSTGTSALEMIFRSIGVDGRDVLVPTNTNFATARAVCAAGGHPVLYDGGLYPSVEDIEERQTSRTAAVVVVHIGGHVSNRLDALRELLEAKDIRLVEDAAHAHGSSIGGRPAGTFGCAAAFSFFPTKALTTYEGGAVVSGDDCIIGMARTLRNQGKDHAGLHVAEGNSWRMSEVGAVLGLVQLNSFAEDQERRAQLLARYRSGFADLTDSIVFPEVGVNDRLSGHKAIALLRDSGRRDQVRELASRSGVTLAGGVYDVPLHRQPVFASLDDGSGFPLAEEFCSAHICLPLWTHMTYGEVDRVVGTIGEALR